MAAVRSTGVSARHLLGIALFAGLALGLVEATLVLVLGLVPGLLPWHNVSSEPMLLIAPLVDGVAFLLLALPVIGVAMLIRRGPWDVVLVLLLAGLSGFIAAETPGHLFSNLASIIIGVGVAVAFARVYAARREAVLAAIPRATGILAITILVVGFGAIGAVKLRERWRLSHLPAAPAGAPNVVLLIIDTQRADRLSVYGYGRKTSPNLERLAAQGVLFEHAYSAGSWTLPSHATIMTGLRAGLHRAGEMKVEYLGSEFVTLAEVLESRGYATGGFVANVFWTGRHTRLNQGFAHYEDYFGNPADGLSRTFLGRWLAYKVLPNHGFIDVPGRKRANEVNRDFLDWTKGVTGRPFFAFLNYMDVHGPYLAPAPFRGRYSNPSSQPRSRSIELGAFDQGDIDLSPAALQYRKDTYDECIQYLDAAIGSLLDSLDAQGIGENTIVILTSDHGEGFGEHGFMFHGRTLYRDQIEVPLIIRYGSHLQPRRVSQPVSNGQIAATVAALLKLPASPFPGPSLLGPDAGSAPVISEAAFRRGNPRKSQVARGWIESMQTERWHFLLFQSGKRELFDLQRDPAELVDLADSAAMADTVLALQMRLKTLVRR